SADLHGGCGENFASRASTCELHRSSSGGAAQRNDRSGNARVAGHGAPRIAGILRGWERSNGGRSADGVAGAGTDHHGSIPGRIRRGVSRASGVGEVVEPTNAKTGMTHSEAREFIRNHFEEFVNKKNV